MIHTSVNTETGDGLSAGVLSTLEHWFRAPEISPSTRNATGRYLAASGYAPSCDQVYSSSAAFVADMVLRDIQHRLPGGLGGMAPRGHSGCLAGPAGPRTRAALHLLPRLLFRLNWATHADDIRWPADYYATWLPGYRRWIVTASTDTRQLWGACNVALGWFDDVVPVRQGVRQTLLTDWRGELASFSPFPWESVVEEGVIDRITANGWRADAWPEYTSRREA